MKVSSVDILDIKIARTSLEDTSKKIEYLIKSNQQVYISVAAVDAIILCQDIEEHKKSVNNSYMTLPDGYPLVWVAQLKGIKDIQRTCGPDLMVKEIKNSNKTQYRHYFYGSIEETNRKLIEESKKLCNTINIVGSYSPPFRNMGELENEKIIDDINKANPDILWVGLGAPKQDVWMYNHRDQLNVPVIIGVGAAFDFIAKVKKRAPLWMQKIGLEWFYRLLSEPRRLWKRYLYGNTRFIYLTLKELILKR